MLLNMYVEIEQAVASLFMSLMIVETEMASEPCK
jgi:hypothetical protein